MLAFPSHCRVERLEPSRRNRIQTVMRASEHADDGGGGIGITAAIDRIDQARLETVGLHQRLADTIDP